MKTIRLMLLACLTATAAAPGTATPRGFDCAKAGGHGGKLVCSGEPVEGRVTLTYAEAGFRGNAGCNEYAAPVGAKDSGGTITVGEVISSGRTCDRDTMAIEQRFLGLLPRVNRFWFHAGQLALDYGEGTDFGVMFLTREE